ncbi:MAG TPA: hypothetical protein VHS56_01565 [Candidatus Cybelea sp.]|jgi:hypothetical protein|nr:hypothetical protein [Candidatus Cybelea sp.]
MRADRLVSQELGKRALVSESGKACWRGTDIEAVLRELTDAGQVVLGFDICERLADGTLKDCGASGFQMEQILQRVPWEECLAMSLALAVRDVRDTKRLTGLEPPFADLWYCVVALDRVSLARYLRGENA